MGFITDRFGFETVSGPFLRTSGKFNNFSIIFLISKICVLLSGYGSNWRVKREIIYNILSIVPGT
jgi:hypothetical protein